MFGLGHLKFGSVAARGLDITLGSMSRFFIPLLSMLLLMPGCHNSVQTRTPPPPEQDIRVAPIRTEADDLEDLAHNVQYAADRVEEGAALKRLQRWQIDHGTTFKLEAANADTKVAVPSPSTYSAPLMAHVTVFRGQQPIYRFSFVPKDNANLALLGQ
jgi:hypothetical protein